MYEDEYAPTPFAAVGSQYFSAASANVLSAALFAAVGCAKTAAAFASKSGNASHAVASGRSPGTVGYLSYHESPAFHQRCLIWTTPCSAAAS